MWLSPLRMQSAEELPTGLSPTVLAQLRRALLAWFAPQARDLPWRRTRDSYAIWVSEVMLQQTRIAVVVPAFERFVARFPTITALAAASEEEVLSLWSGLGYYSRARALHRAAQQLERAGAVEFPRAWEEARQLAGVGPYTAAAVLSIAYALPHAAVDGNIARVLARLRRTPEPGSAALAQALLDRRRPGDWNQALMELGQTVCTPRAPRCSECPLQRWCEAGQAGDAERWPAPKPKRAIERVELVALLVHDRGGRVLLERGVFPALPHLWLPLLGASAEVRRDDDQHLGRFTHAIVHRSFRVEVYRRSVAARRLAALTTVAVGERRIFTHGEIERVGRSSMLTKVLRLAGQPA